MATIERIHDRAVRVGPDVLDAKDVIELAEALIETHGWVLYTTGGPSSGWSLHGAIGEAARILGEADVSRGYVGGKDGPVARPLRDGATLLLNKVLPVDETEYTFNDKADNVDAVLALMRAARGVVS